MFKVYFHSKHKQTISVFKCQDLSSQKNGYIPHIIALKLINGSSTINIPKYLSTESHMIDSLLTC